MIHNSQASGVITFHVQGVAENVMAGIVSRPEKALAMFAPTNLITNFAHLLTPPPPTK